MSHKRASKHALKSSREIPSSSRGNKSETSHNTPPAQRAKIVVGVDYGTTYTGVSWVESTKKHLEDVQIIRAWPGPSKEASETWKTPSRIAYASENNNGNTTFDQWGYLVTPRMKSYSWTKLLLDMNAEASEFDDPALGDLARSQGDGLLKVPYHKSAKDVAADYLSNIYQYFMAELEKRISPEVVRVTPLEFWFTVPAMWDDKAKKTTYDAAKQAGFALRPGDSMFLLPEPQAAAVAVLKTLTTDEISNQIGVGDGILVCDAGGGTVDLTTYCITQAHPNLLFDEMLVGAGGKCGSTWIDREFHQWMSRKFGSKFDSLKFEKKGPGSQFMKEFETAKRDFRGPNDTTEEFEIPLVIRGAQDSQYYDTDMSYVVIPKADMMSFFRPVIEKVVLLLADQVEKVNKKGLNYRINTVILVGGFGDSPYLNNVLKSWCQTKNIRLLCPPHPQAAVVKGAALTGLGGLVPSKKLSRYCYGAKMCFWFREGIDPEQDSWISEWYNRKACYRMAWHIKKGDAITTETFITMSQAWIGAAGDRLTETTDLYCYKYDYPPDRHYDRGVEKVGSITFDLSSVDLRTCTSKWIQGKKQYLIDYELQVSMGSKQGILMFKVVDPKTGRELGKADLKYVMSD